MKPEKVIMILGDWIADRDTFAKAESHLIDTEKKHQIYHTLSIINLVDVLDVLPLFDYRQQIDLALFLLSQCDTVYMLKSWEHNNDVRMLHDYACACNYQIIYSKKF